MSDLAQKIEAKPFKYRVLPLWQFKLATLFSKNARELSELLPRYTVDNLFVSDKLKKAFPHFKITTFEEGIRQVLVENRAG